MATVIAYDQVGSAGNGTAVTITLTSLASSATAGRNSTIVNFADGNNRITPVVDLIWNIQGSNTGSINTNDASVYLYLARSNDGTNFASGPPAPSTSDATFTFTLSPGTNFTDLQMVSAIRFAGTGETHQNISSVLMPPRSGVFVVLNNSGIALSTNAANNAIKYTVRNPEFV